MKAAGLIVCALPLFGQSLQMADAAGGPGQQVSMNISLTSPSGKEPAALQWENIFDARRLSLEGTAPLIGYAAHAAGKTIACAGKSDPSSGMYTYRCILAGGTRNIGNGPVAMLSFRISPQAEGKIRVGLEHAMAVSADAQKTDIRDTEAFVTVRR